MAHRVSSCEDISFEACRKDATFSRFLGEFPRRACLARSSLASWSPSLACKTRKTNACSLGYIICDGISRSQAPDAG